LPRWGSLVILWPCGGHDAGSNLALGLLFFSFRVSCFFRLEEKVIQVGDLGFES
jgi:hypothetical protein